MKYYLLRLDPIYFSHWDVVAVCNSASEALAVAEFKGFRFFRIEDAQYHNRVYRANRDA